MKKLLIVLAALALIAGVGVMKAEAAETGTIAVTVTLKAISVAISPGTLSFDAGIGYSKTITSAFTTTNDGGMNEDFKIKGSIAIGGSINWTLAGTPDVNKFALSVTDKVGTPVQLTTSDLPFGSAVAPAGYFSSNMIFNAPTSGSDTAAHVITITVTASPA